ncbi:MAG: hypothetical protein IKO55_04240 [Kiritimatiellae bacterium]|nr:hypothetical protein [Kiritimatiellia bacterium]
MPVAKTVVIVACALQALAAAEPISVGAVNCGAFHYGKAEVAEGEYAAGWEGLAADNPADVFFYEDVGTNLFPKGSRGGAHQGAEAA